MFTVEDVNTTVYGKGTHSIVFEVDTSLISSDSDFTDVIYDFVKVSRSTSGSNITYTFEVVNSLWAGYYYLLEDDRTWIDDSVTYDDGVVTFTTTEASIIFGMVINPFHIRFYQLEIADVIYDAEDLALSLPLNGLGKEYVFHGVDLTTGEPTETTALISDFGIYTIDYTSGLTRLIKTGFEFECTQTLTLGKVNTINLGADDKYLPNGELIGDYTPKITINYGKEQIGAYYDDDIGDYVFDLDLTDITEPRMIRFTVDVEENKVLLPSTTKVSLNAVYEQITNFNDLVSQCNKGGSQTITLTDDITFTSNIQVKHTIKMVGDDNTLDLNGHSIILDEGVAFAAEDVTFDNGDTSIIQAKNTIVELTGCTFTSCTSDNYNDLGACIFCDIDIDSLTVPDDFTTVLEDCTFTNNNTAILHGGVLSINHCSFTNDDLDYLTPNNPAFIYQTDGEAYVNGSSFKINPPATLCTNTKTAGFAQGIFTLGENATINGQTHQQLQEQTPNICESPYNNQSYVYWKYYYPHISACVYTSPLTGYEARNYCYSLSGINWVYKVNTQVTTNNGNTTTPPF